MSTYRPRPHDHLVEPLFGGLAGAHPAPTEEAPQRAAPRGIGHASVLLAAAVAAVSALVWILA